jgi:CO/xanthine dehydrogenase FAD-binding subunit
LRAIRVEEALIGRAADPDTIALAAMELDAPSESTGDSSLAYRTQLARVCADNALRKAAERAH